MNFNELEPTQRAWWGHFDLKSGPLSWQIGPLALWVDAQEREWRIHWQGSPDPLDMRFQPGAPGVAPPGVKQLRVASGRLGLQLAVSARCPDRPVVVRPEMPFSLLAGEQVDLFIGAAMWLTLAPVGGAAVHELPVFRPTDTWIGPTPRAGTLGYGLRIAARTALPDLVERPGRAVTRLTLINRSPRTLDFERVVLPMPTLSLWLVDGRLWTDTLVYELHGAEQEGTVRVAGPPGGSLMAPPREAREGNAFRRAWTGLFG